MIDSLPNQTQMGFPALDLIDQINPEQPLLQLAKSILRDFLNQSLHRFIQSMTGLQNAYGLWWVCVF